MSADLIKFIPNWREDITKAADLERIDSKILNISSGFRAVDGGLPEDNEKRDPNAKAQREMTAAKPATSEILSAPWFPALPLRNLFKDLSQTFQDR